MIVRLILFCTVYVAASASAQGQNGGSPPPPSAQTSQAGEQKQAPTPASQAAPTTSVQTPTSDGAQTKPLSAIVLEVAGSVDWAKAGVSALVDEGWTASKVDDRYESGTQIRTGLRSHVNLQFGETTTVSIRSATYASIEQFYASAKVENVRVGLGYGTVRGGSSEGEVKSDVIVDSPVATLAKRGTEGWEIEVEPMTGRFRISLAQFGIVEAIQKLGDARSRARTVLPGEYATRANIANMWVNQNIFDRNVTFYAPEAITSADAEFSAHHTQGVGVIAPGGGMTLVDASQRVSAQFILEQTASNLPPTIPPLTTAVGVRGTLGRPEGNFGTGMTFRGAKSR